MFCYFVFSMIASNHLGRTFVCYKHTTALGKPEDEEGFKKIRAGIKALHEAKSTQCIPQDDAEETKSALRLFENNNKKKMQLVQSRIVLSIQLSKIVS